MICIACGYSKLQKFLFINNAPTQVEVIRSERLADDKKMSITLLRCERCTLVQLSKENTVTFVSRHYYDDYLMSRSYSSFARSYLSGLAKDFVKTFGLQKKRIVDVGCGDGFFVSRLQHYGATAIGIDPSESACSLARKRGVTVLHDYVDDAFVFPKGKMDAFVSCQVFEHVSEPGKLLTNIKKFLKPTSYGLIEVPSLGKALMDDRYYDFFPDHVAYYSPTSLSYLLELNGFQVMAVRHTANDEYITAYFRRDEAKSDAINTQREFSAYKLSLQKFFRQRLKNKKIVLWGAGAKGIASISFADILKKEVMYCVDSDPNKYGRFYPGSHIPVVSPETLRNDRPDIVVITAMMYRNEIIETLKKKYKFSPAQIGVIGPIPRLLSE